MSEGRKLPRGRWEELAGRNRVYGKKVCGEHGKLHGFCVGTPLQMGKFWR